jgi:hypothetical protein
MSARKVSEETTVWAEHYSVVSGFPETYPDLARALDAFAASKVREAVERCCVLLCMYCEDGLAVARENYCGVETYVHHVPEAGRRRQCAANMIRSAFAADAKEAR